MRLLALISASETALPVRKALRRALSVNETAGPSRRWLIPMSRQKSYKYFPSLAKVRGLAQVDNFRKQCSIYCIFSGLVSGMGLVDGGHVVQLPNLLC